MTDFARDASQGLSTPRAPCCAFFQALPPTPHVLAWIRSACVSPRTCAPLSFRSPPPALFFFCIITSPCVAAPPTVRPVRSFLGGGHSCRLFLPSCLLTAFLPLLDPSLSTLARLPSSHPFALHLSQAFSFFGTCPDHPLSCLPLPFTFSLSGVRRRSTPLSFPHPGFSCAVVCLRFTPSLLSTPAVPRYIPWLGSFLFTYSLLLIPTLPISGLATPLSSLLYPFPLQGPSVLLVYSGSATSVLRFASFRRRSATPLVPIFPPLCRPVFGFAWTHPQVCRRLAGSLPHANSAPPPPYSVRFVSSVAAAFPDYLHLFSHLLVIAMSLVVGPSCRAVSRRPVTFHDLFHPSVSCKSPFVVPFAVTPPTFPVFDAIALSFSIRFWFAFPRAISCRLLWGHAPFCILQGLRFTVCAHVAPPSRVSLEALDTASLFGPWHTFSLCLLFRA